MNIWYNTILYKKYNIYHNINIYITYVYINKCAKKKSFKKNIPQFLSYFPI